MRGIQGRAEVDEGVRGIQRREGAATCAGRWVATHVPAVQRHALDRGGLRCLCWPPGDVGRLQYGEERVRGEGRAPQLLQTVRYRRGRFEEVGRGRRERGSATASSAQRRGQVRPSLLGGADAPPLQKEER